MYISKIRVQNYKSFLDSGYIEFKQGINIIVGQNNSGKTALLEAIEIKSKNNPHKTIKKSEYAPTYIEWSVFVELNELDLYKEDTIYIKKPAHFVKTPNFEPSGWRVSPDLRISLISADLPNPI